MPRPGGSSGVRDAPHASSVGKVTYYSRLGGVGEDKMDIGVTKLVKISIPPLTEPLEMSMEAAIELRDALVKEFPLTPQLIAVTEKLPPEKWVMRRTTWSKGSVRVSAKMVKALQAVVGKEWNLIDNLCNVTGRSRPMVTRAARVLVQEGVIRIRGRGVTMAVKAMTYEYTPKHDEVPKIDVDEGNHDLTALEKEQKLKREQMRTG